MQTATLSPNISFLERWLDLKIAVFPVHSPSRAGLCSCGKVDCQQNGKHPRTVNGRNDATTDIDRIERWATLFPDCNWGGVTDRLFVVDADDPEALIDFQQDNDDLPETLVLGTGRGQHYVYWLPEGVESRSFAGMVQGIDVRSKGGYIILPGSRHRNGTTYTVLQDVPIAEAPTWLLAKAKSRPKMELIQGNGGTGEGEVASGGRNHHLFMMAITARKLSYASSESLLALLLTENKVKCRPPLSESEIKSIVLKVCRYHPAGLDAAIASGELMPPAPPKLDTPTGPQGEDAWKAGLRWHLSKKLGRDVLDADVGNVRKVLRFSDDWKGCLAYDDFRGQVIWRRDPPNIGLCQVKTLVGEALQDHHATYVREWWLETNHEPLSKDSAEAAIDAAARANPTHEVREWLDTLKWDGCARLGVALQRYWGTTHSEYHSKVGQWWFVSAVARVYKPGCQADSMLVFEGSEGLGKTRAMRALCPADWLQPELPDVRTKDAKAALDGRWIVLDDECAAFSKANDEAVKSFLTQTVDKYRPAYGRNTVLRPRQCVFVANTNRTDYLKAATANRRAWPVACGTIDYVGLATDRDQLWAEAVTLFQRGEKWWPEGDEKLLCAEVADERREHDEWENVFAMALGGPMANTWFLMSDICDFVGLKLDKLDTVTAKRIADILLRLGCNRTRRRIDGIQYRCWSTNPAATRHYWLDNR